LRTLQYECLLPGMGVTLGVTSLRPILVGSKMSDTENGKVTIENEREKEREKAFGRRDSIVRTPPSHVVFDTKDTEEVFILDDELNKEDSHETGIGAADTPGKNPSKKRKAAESPTVTQMRDPEPSSNMQRLKQKAERTEKFCKENRNVHKDIKGLASELFSYTKMVPKEQQQGKSLLARMDEELLELKKGNRMRR
jgi:hypothetical protein